jgi:inosine-uridine nucleoside N-ribohydrolase
MTRQKIILDCDPGHDDAIAILLAARAPELDLRAITVVAGNQTLEKTLNNALRVCEFAGIQNVPIAAGMSRPLVREQVTAGNIHGVSGLDGPHLPPPTMEPVATHAVDLIIQEVMAAPDEIVLVPVGPLTNVASALIREPGLAPRLKAIVLMGGGVTKGNITPVAEFNIYADPEAAHVVFSSGVPITMVGLDVTHQSIPTERDRQRIRDIRNPVAGLVDELLNFFGQTYRRRFGFAGPPIHDAVAVAQVIAPGTVRTRRMNVVVETRGSYTYGMTVSDVHGVTGREPNVDAGLELDRDRFWDLLIQGLGRYGQLA